MNIKEAPMTLSEMATNVITALSEVRPKAGDHEIAIRSNVALALLLQEGWLREYGFTTQGRVLYEPGMRFKVDA